MFALLLVYEGLGERGWERQSSQATRCEEDSWCRLTFSASLREKLLSQKPHGKGLMARWIRLCRFRSWFRLNDCGHWSQRNGRSGNGGGGVVLYRWTMGVGMGRGRPGRPIGFMRSGPPGWPRFSSTPLPLRPNGGKPLPKERGAWMPPIPAPGAVVVVGFGAPAIVVGETMGGDGGKMVVDGA